MFRPKYSNCLIWAMVMLFTRGGYVFFRKSRWGYFPHVLWTYDLKEFWGYSPIDPRRKRCPPVIFRGEPKREEPDGRK